MDVKTIQVKDAKGVLHFWNNIFWNENLLKNMSFDIWKFNEDLIELTKGAVSNSYC